MTLRVVLCQARDTRFDILASNMSLYFDTYGKNVDSIFDTRYINVLKDKKYRIDTPNYGVANTSWNKYIVMKYKPS